ncbi:uncharacterized protein [Nicotiana tomentosiformis]|uniref:uncharacterized protein n=1 Tax=Nicotiana tomentosiformis TaxID=4098 RepID=UPI00051C19D6|nr:uncharacterized protein LOC104099019 [Nicotiana tomentosiformis]
MVEEESAWEIGTNQNPRIIEKSKAHSWSKIVGPVPEVKGLYLTSDEASKKNVKITMEDIDGEIVYWKSVVICYVLGSNPPLPAIDGYFRRIWGSLGIDKVAQVNRGGFLVRFHSGKNRVKAVEERIQMFDKKSMVVKPWEPDIDVSKEQVDNILVWIRLRGMDIKYWDKAALITIVGMVGKPLKADKATTNKERLAFVRVLVKISLSQKYPTSVLFENEWGKS